MENLLHLFSYPTNEEHIADSYLNQNINQKLKPNHKGNATKSKIINKNQILRQKVKLK